VVQEIDRAFAHARPRDVLGTFPSGLPIASLARFAFACDRGYTFTEAANNTYLYL
jgi:hypothetical protein